jgi:HlyD family secretion protein
MRLSPPSLQSVLSMLRHRWSVLAMLACALAVLVWIGPRLVLGPRVDVWRVVQRDFVQTVVASGHVEAPHRVEIGAQVVGRVLRVPVAEGQTVKAGEPLIELDGEELRATVQQAEVAVATAQAHLRQLRELQLPLAQQNLRQAQANLANARAQLVRQQDLYKQGFVGQAALDDATKTVELADAQVRSAQTQLEAARTTGSDYAMALAQLEQARANVDLARARLAYATIAAPADGVLIARDVEPGDVVQPGKDLMVLSPAGETQLVVLIDEKNLGLIALDQGAKASADAFAEQHFDAQLIYINPGIDVQRGSVEVKLRVNDPPNYLRQDMTVSVDIAVARRAGAVIVPMDAVHEAESAHPWVLKVAGGRARRQAVTLGLRSSGLAQVMSGLRPGDEVVPSSAVTVHEGSRVRAVVVPR